MVSLGAHHALLAKFLACVGADREFFNHSRSNDEPSLAIEHPYASATPQGAKTADVYMTVVNKSQMPDRMITGATDVADALQIHEMAVVNGVFAPPCGDPSAAPPTSRGNLQFLLKGSDKLKPEP